MFHKLTRVTTAVALTATLLGGSLLIAPAANAATHKVDASMKTISESVKVGKHHDKITIKATSSKAVLAYGAKGSKVYAAKQYRLTVKNGKHMLYTKSLPTFKALATETEILTHKSFASDTKIVAQVKKDVKRSESKSKTYYQQTTTKLNAEFAVLFLGAYYLGAVESWIQDNPTATTFVGSGLPLTYDKDGLYYTLTGTPQAYTFKAGTRTPAIWFSYNSATDKVSESSNWVHYYTSQVSL